MNKWLFSTNHKDIGILYFMLAIWSGMIGAAMSMFIRLELGSCSNLINNNQIYNSLIMNHTFIMIFFMIMPFMISGFGNFLVPLMLDSDMVYPQMNNMSFWLLSSLTLLILSNFFYMGTAEWTFHPPLTFNMFHSDSSIDLTMMFSLFMLQEYLQFQGQLILF